MLFFSTPPPPLSILPSWSLLPCCLIGTLGKIVGISFHRSPRLSTRVMSCLFGIMHSRRSRSPQTPHLPPSPPRISRSTTEICALSQHFAPATLLHPAACRMLMRASMHAYVHAFAHTSVQQTHPPAESNSHTQLRCRSHREEERGVWSFKSGFSVCLCALGGLSQAFIGS